MGKRQVISIFVAAAAAWLLGSAALAVSVGGLFGDLLFAAATLIVLVLAWGAFTPNTPLFGKVIGRGQGVVAEGGDHVRRRAQRRVHAADPGRACRRQRARHVLRAWAATCAPTPRSHAASSRRGTSSPATATTTGCSHSRGRPRSPTSCVRWTRRSWRRPAAPPSPLFRAPHGFRSPFLVPVARRLGYRVVGWTAGVWDTAKPGVDRIVNRSVTALLPGRDPAAARRRRLRQRRRPLADRRGAAADPRSRQGAGTSSS